MSLDNFSECATCKQNTAIPLWIQIHRTIGQAKRVGDGLGILSVILPGPGVMKVVVCYTCVTFKPTADFTPEEIEEMKKYATQLEQSSKLGEDIGRMFGFPK